MVKVSVIIPVYNAEKHLRKCIESLLGQTMLEIELIFVNDGSSDSSNSIIEKYRSKDNRIKIISKNNEGVSIARNTGIAAATAEFIAFADADDFVENDMLSTLYEIAVSNDADIVVSNYFKTLDSIQATVKLPFIDGKVVDNVGINEQIIPYFLREEILNQCWNKLYKTSLLRYENVKFPQGVALGEDGLFNISAFLQAKRVVFTEYAGYHYEENAGSATRDMSKHDYFASALKQYKFDHQSIPGMKLSASEIEKYKSIKLVNHVLAYVGMYFQGGLRNGLLHRILYVKNMISNEIVRKTAALHFDEIAKGKTRYQIFILNCIINKKSYLLIAAALYSNFRNTKK